VGHEGAQNMGMQLCRLEQISARTFIIALPLLLHSLSENIMPRISKILILTGIAAFSFNSHGVFISGFFCINFKNASSGAN
jgi:hypothetical protein